MMNRSLSFSHNGAFPSPFPSVMLSSISAGRVTDTAPLPWLLRPTSRSTIPVVTNPEMVTLLGTPKDSPQSQRMSVYLCTWSSVWLKCPNVLFLIELAFYLTSRLALLTDMPFSPSNISFGLYLPCNGTFTNRAPMLLFSGNLECFHCGKERQRLVEMKDQTTQGTPQNVPVGLADWYAAFPNWIHAMEPYN